MKLGTTSHYLALHHHSVRVRPPLPALKNPVEHCIWRFAGLFLFGIKRAYYNLRHNEDTLTAQGIIKGKHVVFRISTANNDAFVPDMYNENVLFVDGIKTLLPPVKITRPSGFQGKWIIQDTESMIDLSFTPRSDDLRLFSIFILHARYHTIQGSFSGVLLTKDSEEIHLKDFTGIAGKQRIRL